MCMMRPPINKPAQSFKARKKQQKPSFAYDKEARMKPDPNFVDERKVVPSKEKKSFWKLFG